jgi:predicted nucleic-acid-binding protein
MIGLDTNVLVRFLVEDDEEQCRRATRLIADAVERKEDLFISDLVMCETVWVLTSAYRFSRAEVAEVLSRFLRAKQITFASSDRLARTLDAFRNGSGDFADYLIREHAASGGCTTVMTFDKPLLKERGFTEP